MRKEPVFVLLALVLLAIPPIAAQSCTAESANCCGNSTCDSTQGEDFGTCQKDCTTPKTVDVFILSPQDGDQFARGDTVVIQARVNADSVQNAQANRIYAIGKTGNIDLFDDGRHNDEKAGDHVYGNAFVVTDEYQQQRYRLPVTATVEQTTNTAEVSYSVTPYLAASVGTDRDTYALGDEITITGLVTRKGVGVALDANLMIAIGDESLLRVVVTTDGQGRFSYTYQTATIQPEGTWKFELSARDESGNFGHYEKTVQVRLADALSTLSIAYLTETTETHKSGEHVIIEAEVRDAFGAPVTDATVTLQTPYAGTAEIPFEPTRNKTYSLLYKIPHDSPVGQQRFEIHATRMQDNVPQTAVYPFVLRVEQSPLSVFLVEPLSTQFAIGDTIPIKAKISYPDNQPVQNAFVEASVNDQRVELVAAEPGVYQGQYTVREEDPQSSVLSIRVRDPFDNSGTTRTEFYIKGENPLHALSRNALPLLVAAIVVAVGGVTAIRTIRHRKSTAHRLAQKKSLERFREDLQKRYYMDKVITRETYDRERIALETKIEKVDKELAKLASTEQAPPKQENAQ
jgi:hypothetical protein